MHRSGKKNVFVSACGQQIILEFRHIPPEKSAVAAVWFLAPKNVWRDVMQRIVPNMTCFCFSLYETGSPCIWKHSARKGRCNSDFCIIFWISISSIAYQWCCDGDFATYQASYLQKTDIQQNNENIDFHKYYNSF